MKILLVCTGNTCRSPLAEVLLRRAVAEVGVEGVEVASAGTGALVGGPASEGSYLVALENGLDLAGHRARLVTPEMLGSFDLILAMGRGHLRKLELLGSGDRVHLLADYARADGEAEVADPVGGPIEGYRAVYHRLDELTRSVARRLGSEARHGRR